MEERELLEELHREHRIPGTSKADPLPMIGLAQLYRRDVLDLPDRPDGCDLLQVFWCPFNAHGPGGYDLELQLRWRRSSAVGEVLTPQPQPLAVESDGFVPKPCILHPEQVVTYPFAGQDGLESELIDLGDGVGVAQDPAGDDAGRGRGCGARIGRKAFSSHAFHALVQPWFQRPSG